MAEDRSTGTSTTNPSPSEISAVNTLSSKSSIVLIVDSLIVILLCLAHDTASCDALLTLNTAAVVGVAITSLVAIAVVYRCGLLTGLLVRRKKNHTPSASGDLSALPCIN